MNLVELFKVELYFDMSKAGQQEYPELNTYINNFIKPNDSKAWLAILVSIAY